MLYRTAGAGGPSIPVLTLGLMVRDCRPGMAYESVRETLLKAVESGITSIDLATGYGGGSVETAVGNILRQDLPGRRQDLFLATKAGWGDGSPRALSEALDRSLRQLGMDHVDLYYHHAPDLKTPFDVTAEAMGKLVREGKTRYIGISNYSLEQTQQMVSIMRGLGVPCILHQANYNPLNRWVEDGLLKAVEELGMGMAVFSALNQGLLSHPSVPAPRAGSRAEKALLALVAGVAGGEPAYGVYPRGVDVHRHVMRMLSELRDLADERGQTLDQMTLAWILRHPQVTTVLVGLSDTDQVGYAVGTLRRLAFSNEELKRLEAILPPRPGNRDSGHSRVPHNKK